jgi:hypothetical protein
MAATFKLYLSNGTTLQYTFPVVFQANYPHTEKKLIEHESVRGKGSIVIDGGDSAWDLNIKGVLRADNYNALMTLVDDMETKIILNTAYVLKITKSSALGTNWEYKVKRIVPIQFQEDSLRINFIEYTCTLRVNTWV